MIKTKSLIVILGPTGVGKTRTAIEVARKLKTEIISCDSRQIYREIRIGTAVPTDSELAEVKHHLIQSRSIYEYYNASMFEFEALDLLDKLYRKQKNVLMVGGSGLYINAVCYGIDDLPTIDPALRKELAEKYENEGIESIRALSKQISPIGRNPPHPSICPNCGIKSNSFPIRLSQNPMIKSRQITNPTNKPIVGSIKKGLGDNQPPGLFVRISI